MDIVMANARIVQPCHQIAQLLGQALPQPGLASIRHTGQAVDGKSMQFLRIAERMRDKNTFAGAAEDGLLPQGQRLVSWKTRSATPRARSYSMRALLGLSKRRACDQRSVTKLRLTKKQRLGSSTR